MGPLDQVARPPMADMFNYHKRILKCIHKVLTRHTLTYCRYGDMITLNVYVKCYPEHNVLNQDKIIKKTKNKVFVLQNCRPQNKDNSKRNISSETLVKSSEVCFYCRGISEMRQVRITCRSKIHGLPLLCRLYETYSCKLICMCVCVCMYVCMYEYVYVWIYIILFFRKLMTFVYSNTYAFVYRLVLTFSHSLNQWRVL
jgi:hypothetical protein